MSEDSTSRWIGIAAAVLFLAVPTAALALTGFNLLRLTETEALIGRQEALLSQLDARLARLNAGGTAPVDASAIYVPATSRALAGAVLQQRLDVAVESAGGRLIETQELQEIEGAPADLVRLRTTLDVGNAGLLALLHGLESGLPLITVDGVTIRRLPARDGEGDDDPMLRVDFVARAYWRAGP